MPTTNTHVPLWGGSCWAQDDGVLVSCRVSQYNLYYKAHSQDERILVTKFCDVRGFRLSLFIYHAVSDFSVLWYFHRWVVGWMDSSSHTRIHIYSPTLISTGRLMRKPIEFNHSSTYFGFFFENAAETELVKNAKLKQGCILQYKMRSCQNQNQHNKGVKNGLFLRFPTSKCLPPNKTSM